MTSWPRKNGLFGAFSLHRVFIFQLTETVASQFERCDEPPYFRPLKTSSTSRDSVSEVPSVEGTGVLNQKGMAKQNSVSKEDVKIEEGSRKDSKDERKESREERRDAKDDRREKGDSLPRGIEGSGMTSVMGTRRIFSRAAGCFGVGLRPIHFRLTAGPTSGEAGSLESPDRPRKYPMKIFFS